MVEGFLNAMLDKEIKDSFSIIHYNNHQFDLQPLCRLTYNRIFLISKGSGVIRIDDETYPITGNELFLLAKGQVYAFDRHSRISGYELCFGDCFWEKTPASASNCKAVLFNNA